MNINETRFEHMPEITKEELSAALETAIQMISGPTVSGPESCGLPMKIQRTSCFAMLP